MRTYIANPFLEFAISVEKMLAFPASKTTGRTDTRQPTNVRSVRKVLAQDLRMPKVIVVSNNLAIHFLS